MSAPIFLIGPMASGKSAVGALVAALLGTELIDTDARVVAAHGDIPSIFAAGGEPRFRALEAQVLSDAVKEWPASGPPAVIATGGGAVLAAANREIIARGFCVYLFTDALTVAPRIGADTTRPLLGGTPLESWKQIFATRSETYESMATLRIDTRAKTPAQIAELILTAYSDAEH
ncbi:MAG: shikimate kinase [Paeniglutamicibacter terrestris]|jgi:shikimate kinase